MSISPHKMDMLNLQIFIGYIYVNKVGGGRGDGGTYFTKFY